MQPITAEGLPERAEVPQGAQQLKIVRKGCVSGLLLSLYSYSLGSTSLALYLALMLLEASILVDPQVREAGRGSRSDLSSRHR